MPRVRCQVCFRIEDWSNDGSGRAPVVVQEGGSRRPSVAPQWERGRTALRSFAGELGPVVGVCEACGQLLVAEEPGISPIEVRIDTPRGALLIGRTLRGPAGELSLADAHAFLASQYAEAVLPALLAQVPQVLLLSTMSAPVLLFIACVLAIYAFLLSAWVGLPDVVRGH